jgi:hypothetical protein
MASAAKNQFQDAMAKGAPALHCLLHAACGNKRSGQPLKISYDHSKPRGLGEGAGLLARLGGYAPLLPALTCAHIMVHSDVLDRRNDRDRPARGGRGGSFGTSSGRGGPARGRGGRGGGGGGAPRSTPKTEADLDAELESFMRSDAPAKANGVRRVCLCCVESLAELECTGRRADGELSRAAAMPECTVSPASPLACLICRSRMQFTRLHRHRR